MGKRENTEKAYDVVTQVLDGVTVGTGVVIEASGKLIGYLEKAKEGLERDLIRLNAENDEPKPTAAGTGEFKSVDDLLNSLFKNKGPGNDTWNDGPKNPFTN